MSKRPDPLRIPLPPGWPRRVKSAVRHRVAPAQYVSACTRGWAIDSPIRPLPLKTENDRLRKKIALLTEKIRTTDARMKQIEPQTRPHDVPTERTAIFELRAAPVIHPTMLRMAHRS